MKKLAPILFIFLIINMQNNYAQNHLLIYMMAQCLTANLMLRMRMVGTAKQTAI